MESPRRAYVKKGFQEPSRKRESREMKRFDWS